MKDFGNKFIIFSIVFSANKNTTGKNFEILLTSAWNYQSLNAGKCNQQWEDNECELQKLGYVKLPYE